MKSFESTASKIKNPSPPPECPPLRGARPLRGGGAACTQDLKCELERVPDFNIFFSSPFVLLIIVPIFLETRDEFVLFFGTIGLFLIVPLFLSKNHCSPGTTPSPSDVKELVIRGKVTAAGLPRTFQSLSSHCAIFRGSLIGSVSKCAPPLTDPNRKYFKYFLIHQTVT